MKLTKIQRIKLNKYLSSQPLKYLYKNILTKQQKKLLKNEKNRKYLQYIAFEMQQNLISIAKEFEKITLIN